MKLRGQNEKAEYSVTPEDVLWLSRAVEAEGPVCEQVAGTLCNGFLWARARRGYTGDLTDWVRAYAQPINPRWYPSGDLFLAHLRKSGDESGELLRTAERRVRVHSTRTTFSAATRNAVVKALRGQAAIPSSATDYAAAWYDAGPKGYTEVFPDTVVHLANRLWSRPGAEGWQGYLSDGAHTLSSRFPWLLCAAAVAWFALRRG